MSYIRVIPRDLFNEADLLKCLGTLELKLDNAQDHKASLTFDGSINVAVGFDVDQNPDDGSIYSTTVEFVCAGTHYELYRPLNSRDKWPLYVHLVGNGDDDIRVFEESGNLSREFCEFITHGNPS